MPADLLHNDMGPTSRTGRRGPFFFLLKAGREAIRRLALCAMFAVVCMCPAAAADPPGLMPKTAAPIAVLMDGYSGSILAEKDGARTFNPGDMVKLITAEVVFDALKRRVVTLDSEFVVSERAWQRGRGGSMFALLNSYIRVEDLLRGITVLSADDAAIALAEGLGKNELDFVKLMNKRAQQIGLNRTFFLNSTGSGIVSQSTTARDLARLAQHLSTRYPEYFRLYGEKELTWSDIRQQNRNPLLFLNASADGIKAARKTSDGYALVGTAKEDGKQLIAVVAGLETAQEAAESANELLQWGGKSFAPRALFLPDEAITQVSVYGGSVSAIPVVSHAPVNILWREGMTERLSMRIDYRGPLQAPVRKGDAIGELKVMRSGVLALSVPVYAGADVAEGTMQQKAASGLGELTGRAFRSLWRQMLTLVKVAS